MQLEAQLPQTTQMRKLRCALIFYFKAFQKLRCRLKSLKFVALSIFFRLIVQFYTIIIIIYIYLPSDIISQQKNCNFL